MLHHLIPFLVFIYTRAMTCSDLDGTNCFTCVRTESWASNCRWCPDTQTCHAYGSGSCAGVISDDKKCHFDYPCVTCQSDEYCWCGDVIGFNERKFCGFGSLSDMGFPTKRCTSLADASNCCTCAAIPGPAAAYTTEVYLEGYSDSRCKHIVQARRLNGCESLTWEGNTYYVFIGCSFDGDPYLYICDDSSCGSCQQQGVGGGICHVGFNVLPLSFKLTCEQAGKPCPAPTPNPDPIPAPAPAPMRTYTGEADVVGYSDSSCRDTVLARRFTGCGCESLALDGNTYYGIVGCSESGQPYFSLCEDSSCESCQPQDLVGSGICGNGFGVLPSSKLTCVSGAWKPLEPCPAASSNSSFLDAFPLWGILLICGVVITCMAFAVSVLRSTKPVLMNLEMKG